MDAATYPDTGVKRLFQESLVPLRVPHDREPLASRYNALTTPLLIVLDGQARAVHRIEGVRPPEELIPDVLLGLAKLDFQAGRYARAVEGLNRLLAEYAQSQAVPESILLRGQCLHRQTGDTSSLRAAYELLARDHPDSPWTRQASRYRLL